MFIKPGSRYRYYDKTKNIDWNIYIKSINKNNYVQAMIGNKIFECEYNTIKDKLYNEKGYNIDGYDIHGYDARGYDKYGYNINGINEEGYDQNGNAVSVPSSYQPSCYAGTKTTSQRSRDKNDHRKR